MAATYTRKENVMKRRILSLFLAYSVLFSALSPQRTSVANTDDVLRISAESVLAIHGGVVDVIIRVESNPGIFGLQLQVDYDADVLEPLSGAGVNGNLVPLVAGSVLPISPMVFPIATANPLEIIFVDMSMENSTDTGVLVAIPFRVIDSTVSWSDIVLTVVETHDENFNAVPYEVTNGRVDVVTVVITRWVDVSVCSECGVEKSWHVTRFAGGDTVTERRAAKRDSTGQFLESCSGSYQWF
jgi:hypothetical protein